MGGQTADPEHKSGWPLGKQRKPLLHVTELASTGQQATAGETPTKLSSAQEKPIEHQATTRNTSSKVSSAEEEPILTSTGVKERLISTNVILGTIKRLLSDQNMLIREQNQHTKKLKDLVIELRDKF